MSTPTGPATGPDEPGVVERFGPARLASGISATWLLAALVLLALAATYLVKAVDLAVLMRREAARDCQDTFVDVIGMCISYQPVMYQNAVVGLAALLLAAGLLVARRLTIRLAGLAATPRWFPLPVAAAFATVGFGLVLANPTTPLGRRVFPDGALFGVPSAAGLWHQVIASGVALLIAAAAVTWYAVRANRRRFAGALYGADRSGR